MAAQLDKKSEQYVEGGLYGSRHQQLTLLREVKIPSGSAYNRRVGSGSLKNVLKSIDSIIGKNESYWIPIADLVESTGLSEATVSGAIAVLRSLFVIDVTERFEVRGDKRLQLPSRFRIVWSNLHDLLPVRVVDEPREIVEVTTVETPANESTPPLTVSPGWTHSEWGVDSQRVGGGLTVSPPWTQSECRTCPTSPNLSLPSPKADEEGKLTFWQKAVQQPQQLRQAVKNRDATWMQQAWSEAVAAGWQPDTRDGFQRFLAAAFYVINPPKGMLAINSPTRVLRDKLITNDWRTGRMDGLDDDWAKAMLRAIEQPEPIARSSDLTETVAAAASTSVATQLSKLQQLKKAT